MDNLLSYVMQGKYQGDTLHLVPGEKHPPVVPWLLRNIWSNMMNLSKRLKIKVTIKLFYQV